MTTNVTATFAMTPPRARPVRTWRRVLRKPTAVVSGVVVVAIVLACLAAPLIAPYDPDQTDLQDALAGPSAEHLLGTDRLGRDLLSRLLWGGIPSLRYAGIVLGVALLIGVVVGILGGYVGGWVDRVLSFVTDIGLSIPVLIMTILVLTVLNDDFELAMVILGFLVVPPVARNVRGAVLAVRRELFVDAARVAGLGAVRIMTTHILPRVVGPILVQAALLAGLAVGFTAGLSFLGFGPPPPASSWGAIIADASLSMSTSIGPMLVSGGLLAVFVLALLTLGEAIRQATVEAWAPGPALSRPRSRRGIREPAARREASAEGGRRTPGALLEVHDLRIAYPTREQRTVVVDGVTFSLHAGESVGVVGESGSGKSTVARSIMRILAGTGEVVGGEVRFDGADVYAMSPSELRAYRRSEVGYVFQDPMSTLEPSMKVGDLLVEVLRAGSTMSRREARAESLRLLGRVRVPDPEEIARRYPHELSGGLAQRVAIARAIARRPRLLIADEPTTALDASIRLQILDLLRELRDTSGLTLLVVSHDWDVIGYLCDRAIVMYRGQIVESADVDDLLHRSEHPYTRALLECRIGIDADRDAALPTIAERVAEPVSAGDAPPSSGSDAQAGPPVRGSLLGREPREGRSTGTTPLLAVEDLTVEYRRPGGRMRPVDGVSFEIAEGETLGLLGESGSGKTTIGRAVLGLVPVASGRIWFRGVDIARLSSRERRRLGSSLRAVFQDPYSSLNPVRPVASALLEGLPRRDREVRRGMDRLLRLIGLDPSVADSYPGAFSGGQRQRIAIARALMSNPALVVCDEPVTALDLSVQAQVLNVFRDAQRISGVGYLFIGHDIEVVRYMSDRIAVLQSGEIVEVGPSDQVVSAPEHPYTRRLLDSMVSAATRAEVGGA